MSQTLGQKLTTLLSAKLHDIVNRALQGNPIAVLSEYLRQHEEAYAELGTNMGLAGGRLKSEKRHVEEAQAIVDQITAEISRILTDKDPSNDYLANNLSIDLVGKEKLLATNNRALEAAQSAYSALQVADNKLYGRILSLKNQIALLKAIQSEADMKGLTADILMKSADMISTGAASVESFTETVMQNRDRADAKFEVALQRMQSSGSDALVQSEADARLAQIRAKLGVDTDTSSQRASLDMSAEDLSKLAAVQ